MNIILRHLCSSFNFICVIKVREHIDYNINEYETSFKIFLCILMILSVKMML
jgi:hypothetical protein